MRPQRRQREIERARRRVLEDRKAADRDLLDALAVLPSEDLPQLFQTEPPPFKIVVGKAEVTKLKTSYSQGTPGELFAIEGSMGFLEIATNRGAAARTALADKGSEVGVILGAPEASGTAAAS